MSKTVTNNPKRCTGSTAILSVTTNGTAVTISNSNIPTGISIDPYNVKLEAKQIEKLKKLSEEGLKLLLNKLKAENIYREMYHPYGGSIYETIEIEKELANRAVDKMLGE